MSKLTSIAVSLILAVVCTAMVASDMYQPPVDEQVRPIAIVRRFVPTVTMFDNSEQRKFELNLTENIGENLFSGDTLSTNAEGYALVIFTDNSVAKVKPESMLIIHGEEIANSKISNRRVNLEKGEVQFEVEPIGSGTFEVATSRSVASVKGTRFGNKAAGYIWVDEGQVDVTALNSGQTVSLFEKMFAEVDENGNNINSGTLTNDELNQLNEGYDTLDEDLVEKTITVRFRDANGQIREIEVNILEKGN